MKFSLKGLALSLCLASLIFSAVSQAPQSPPVDPSPVQPSPVETPVATPVETPVETPVATPAATPEASPVQPPVESPQQSPQAEPTPTATPVQAPVDPTPVSTPVQAPIASPVASPIAQPIAAPVQAPVAAPQAVASPQAPSECNLNGCRFENAVSGVTSILFGGIYGAQYSPRCVRVNIGDTVSWNGSFTVHPLVQGKVIGSTAYPSGSPIVSEYSATFNTAGVYPFYCNSHYKQGMMGAVYVGNGCSTGAPVRIPAPVSTPTPSPLPVQSAPSTTVLSCEINGCNARNTRQIQQQGRDPVERVIDFGGDYGSRFSLPCLYIPADSVVSLRGDFSRYPIRPGFADGTFSLPSNIPAFQNQLAGVTGVQMVNLTLPVGVYPYYNQQYQSLGMYGAIFVGVCSSAAGLVFSATALLVAVVSAIAIRF